MPFLEELSLKKREKVEAYKGPPIINPRHPYRPDYVPHLLVSNQNLHHLKQMFGDDQNTYLQAPNNTIQDSFVQNNHDNSGPLKREVICPGCLASQSLFIGQYTFNCHSCGEIFKLESD